MKVPKEEKEGPRFLNRKFRSSQSRFFRKPKRRDGHHSFRCQVVTPSPAMKGVLILVLAILAMCQAFVPIAPTRLMAAGRMQNLVMRERKCDLSGTRKNSKAMNVSKSNAHTHRTQEVNLQTKKLWWEEGNKFVRIRISARTLKTIKKNGLNATAKKFGVNLDTFALSSGTAPTPELASA